MIKSKRYFAEMVVNSLTNDYPNIDWKIDERDIFVQLDSIVNAEARAGFFDNWKAGAPGVSEGFITTWDADVVGTPAITVVDQQNGKPSYFAMPVNYADLPMEQGIQEIWPQKYQSEGKNHSVVILTHRDLRLHSNLMSGNMGGRLAGYPKGNIFEFTSAGVKKKYGDMGIRLVVRSSSLIAIDAPYPIPSSKEDFVIKMCAAWFREKRNSPTDRVRDKNDQAA